MIMKKYIISWFALLILINNYSQNINRSTQYLSYEDAFNESAYAFEGIIIKKSAYLRDNKPVLSDIVRITKVFRGNLSIGTVEIVNYVESLLFESPKMLRKTYEIDQLKKEKVDTFGIFFCKVANELTYDPKFNINSVDNKIVLSDYSNDPFQHRFNRILRTHYGYQGGPPGEHDTKAKIYKLLKKYPSLKIPDYSEPEPIDTTLKQIKFGHHYSKHASDSLSRVNNSDAFDSTGKFIDYGHSRKTK